VPPRSCYLSFSRIHPPASGVGVDTGKSGVVAILKANFENYRLRVKVLCG
jgi:hypothetical protein